MIKNLKTLLCMVMLMFAVGVNAQVTTSSISGIVIDEKGEPVNGALIEAKHKPSGSIYGAATNNKGHYLIQGMRAGGPYSVDVYVKGMDVASYENIFLELGNTTEINVDLGETLNTVVYSKATDSQLTNDVRLVGSVVDEKLEPMIGATVEIRNQQAAVVKGVATDMNGQFSVSGLKDGVYNVRVSFIGYSGVIVNAVEVKHGEVALVNTRMEPLANMLQDVVVSGVRTKFTGVKTGASTNISASQMKAIPTVNRSISDMVRLSPYAGSGMSFAGGDGRSTNFTVDGANFNNNFGLTDNLPGGGTPISVEALEEMQVVIAPFDLRQTNFVGGGVNAITKSGTNTFKGSAYTYQYNEDMRGNRAGGEELGDRGIDRKHVYGATLGGPIIKDKLFFFGNFEYQKIPTTATEWKASADGVANASSYVSRTTLSDLERVSKHVKEKYGYNTGSWTNFPADESNVKFLARIDWNITRNHKLALRYNYTKNQYWNAPNGNSTDAGYRNKAYNRMSEMSMAFANSMYSQDNVVHSFSGDLNSRFGNNISNQLLVTYTSIKDMRGSESDIFPFIDIMGGYDASTGVQNMTPYMSLGYELFTYNNGVNNKILTVNDNFTYNLGAHKLMAGISFEHQMANNSYMRNGTGYYRYRSLDDFLNGAEPEAVAFTIGYNGQTVPSAQVRFNQYGLYLQDEWSVNKRFKLNYGVRFDLLAFNDDDIMTNEAVKAYNYGGRHIDTGIWPSNKVNINPRVGFNWDVLGDKSLTVRGGTGLFTGRLPLVFFTNMPTNSGMVQNAVKNINTTYNSDGTIKSKHPDLAKFAGGLITDVYKMAEIAGAQTTIAPDQGVSQSTPCGIDKDFRMPQVWKSSIAVDYQIPVSFPFSVTGEFMYTKNVNAVMLENYNIKPVDETWKRFSGSDNRLIYPSDYTYYGSKEISTACVLTNTNKGYGYTANITLKAQPIKELNLMLAYTRTESKEVSGMPGSDAKSAWSGLYTIDGPNYATVQRSQYVTPDRFIASVGYDLHKTTHLNLFYTCYSPYGYSFFMSNDMNGDGIATDLIYIPKDENDIIFVGANAEQDAKDFWAFVNQDNYLKNHKGEYAEAYAARAPFVHRFDFRIAQDINFRIGKTKHQIQLSFDFMNVGNLFNSNWGVAKNMSSCNNGAILTYAGQNEAGNPTYTLYRDKAGNAPTKTWEYNRASSQCWQLQFGARYTF